MPTLANLLLRPSRGPAMHDSRPGDGSERAPVHYTMKASSRPSPSSDGSLPRSDSHSPRASKSSKAATTPSLSSRPSCSLVQNNIPMRSPTRHIDVRAPSPNYFGLSFESVADSRDSPPFAREPWGQASPLAKSFSPPASKHPTPPEPVVENAEFEAFRRQVDQSRAKSFSLPPSLLSPSTHPTPSRPRPPRWHTHATDTSRCVTSKQPPATTATPLTCANSYPSSANPPVAAAAQDPDLESPMPSSHSADSPSRLHPTPSNSFTPLRPTLSTAEDGHFELSPSARDADSSPSLPEMRRAVTLPSPCQHRSLPMISGPHLKNLLETGDDDCRLLLLDIRSSQNHAQSRIRGALNLCIPTTLLKRPNFNTQKLQQTFQGGPSWEKFSRWKNAHWIVVYDAHGSAKGDAIAAQNMVKKFTNEGYPGNIAILRGGFEAFQNEFPELVDDEPPNSPADGQPPSPMGSNGGVAPVIGGVSLPTCANRPNPFFSNIRQNMDLADGVGQLEVSLPPGLDLQLLPQWLRVAASKSDHGKSVSDKFLRIELDEQSRMRNAYAAFDPKANRHCRFQLSGVEKGGKNRYKDILPFEHARVKLQKESDSSCDYVNASHLRPSGSKKRYIATQGPLPDTFEDFWSVVWQQDVRVIVMLTAQSEGGQLKCHAYWEGCHFGTFRLKLLSKRTVSLATGKHRPDSRSATLTLAVEDAGSAIGAGTGSDAEPSSVAAAPAARSTQEVSDAPHVVIRTFGLSHVSKPSVPMREIAHLHFPDWPDFGTPAQPSHLLALVEMANAMQRTALVTEMGLMATPDPPWTDGCCEALANGSEVDEGTRPMLVHCSAGCGRTGAFCTVDSVIDMMKRQRLAKMAEPRSVDGQGDVSMAGYDDVMSPPRAGQQSTVASHSQEEGDKGRRETDVSEPLHLQFPWLLDDSIDLVQRTVAEFREQRLSMVQSLRQYVLCYESILEWIHRRQERTTLGRHGDQPTSGLEQPGQGSI